MAVERCPTRPDYQGLDFLTHTAVSQRGTAQVPKFAAWVAEKQKERATVWRQRRQYAEEQAAAASSWPGRGEEGDC